MISAEEARIRILCNYPKTLDHLIKDACDVGRPTITVIELPYSIKSDLVSKGYEVHSLASGKIQIRWRKK